MSDDEREYSEEEEEEDTKRSRGRDTESQLRQKTPHLDDGVGKSEAELIMEEKLKKKKDEEDEAWRECIDAWRKQRAKEEEELKKLKDKQAKRKTLRQQEERKMTEQKKQQEEARAKEMEEKRQREQEEKRRRLEEAEKKRQAMLKQSTAPTAEGKPNFVIAKRTDGGPGANLGSSAMDKMMNVAAARGDMGKTKEQLAEEKKIAMTYRIKSLDIDGLDKDGLKEKAKNLWETIVRLETEKYDLEERQKRQEYDLKELNERQRQINRSKALKKGLDAEALTGKYPPKLQVASKYERRIDRRTYGDKKGLWDGGFEVQYTQGQEKTWEDRMQSFVTKKGKLPKWLGEQPGKKPGDPDDEEVKKDVVQKTEVVEEEEEEEDEEEEE